MPRTIFENTGDGTTANLIQFVASLPDAGVTVPIAGQVQAVGGSLLAITGSPLTSPVIPGAGSTYWIIQVNTTTGAATIKQSSSAYPTPDAGNIQIFQTQLQSTDTSLSLDADNATPDTW